MSFIRRIKRGNRIYLAEVENQRSGGKVKQRFIRYLGVELDQNKKVFPSSNADLSIDGVKVFGSVICLDSLARRIGLFKFLGEHAPPILSLVYCHCHDYRSVLDAERWVNKTDLCKIFDVKEITEKHLRIGLSALGKLDHFTLQKSIFEMISTVCETKNPSSVVYDVTNTYLEGHRSGLARQGKDKEGVKGRRLIQIGLGITKEHGIPIFHQVHRGNVHDAKIFKEAILLLQRYGISHGTIVHDRGITAKSSILQLSSLRWKVIAGVTMHRHMKHIISKMDFSKLENYRNRVEQGVSTFYVMTLPHAFGDVSGRLVVLLNPLKMQVKRDDRKRQIAQAQDLLRSGDEIDAEMKRYFTKENTVNAHAIKRAERFDGVSILFATGKLSREDMVHMYFGKDLIEKSFQTFKSTLALRPIRHWLDENVQAHIMVCYLSYCLLTTFRFLLYKNRGNKHLNGLTVEKALDELSAVYRVYYSKQSLIKGDKHGFSQIITMTERQKAIMRTVCQKGDL